MRRAKVYMHEKWAGTLIEDESGYHFQYRKEYLDDSKAEPISLTIPLQEAPFQDKVLFPFFDGLIPEGWLLEIAEKNWKLNPRDRMGLLLTTCHDCIGAVSIIPFEGEEQ
ncbi:MAG: HipA N-terminal domain-containing protein [Sporocytophaga sp.]|nr:HipA N-terminal domain-containing protein [Sporocytophaga sp.]